MRNSKLKVATALFATLAMISLGISTALARGGGGGHGGGGHFGSEGKVVGGGVGVAVMGGAAISAAKERLWVGASAALTQAECTVFIAAGSSAVTTPV